MHEDQCIFLSLENCGLVSILVLRYFSHTPHYMSRQGDWVSKMCVHMHVHYVYVHVCILYVYVCVCTIFVRLDATLV